MSIKNGTSSPLALLIETENEVFVKNIKDNAIVGNTIRINKKLIALITSIDEKRI